MRYVTDHDLHIHSHFSVCSSDARQTPEAILAYGLASGFRLLALTDHAWDDEIPCPTPFQWGAFSAAKALSPLPQSPKCRFVFGLEADMNCFDTFGLTLQHAEELELCLLSVSHMHSYYFGSHPELHTQDPEESAVRYKKRLHLVMDAPLPFEKCGLPHFTTGLVCPQAPVDWLKHLSDRDLEDIFTKAATKGIGIELNFDPFGYNQEDLRTVLHPYFIAKKVGCTFYFGGDAHHPENFFATRTRFEKIVDLLELEEKHKFPYVTQAIAKGSFEEK